MNRIPYTYLIGWTKLNKWYYGCRSKKGCQPNLFWIDYHTSSKYVAWMREFYGEPDVIQVRKIFKNKEQAMKWERLVLKRLNVVNKDMYLNKSDAFGSPTGGMTSHKHSNKTKQLMSEKQSGKNNPMYGKTHSQSALEKIAIASKNRVYSNEYKKKMSEARKGISNRGRGWTLTQETKNKIKLAMIGKGHTEERKLNISNAHKGKSWFNNGVKSTLCYAENVPSGYVKGRLIGSSC